MTRGREGTNVDARSPRLAMTSRGVKVLEHLKNKPELRGTVVPWLRGHAMGQHGAVSMVRLRDEHGRPLAPRGRQTRRTASLRDEHAIRAMVERARRRGRVGVVQGEGDIPTGSGALPIRQADACGSAIPMRETFIPHPL